MNLDVGCKFGLQKFVCYTNQKFSNEPAEELIRACYEQFGGNWGAMLKHFEKDVLPRAYDARFKDKIKSDIELTKQLSEYAKKHGVDLAYCVDNCSYHRTGEVTPPLKDVPCEALM